MTGSLRAVYPVLRNALLGGVAALLGLGVLGGCDDGGSKALPKAPRLAPLREPEARSESRGSSNAGGTSAADAGPAGTGAPARPRLMLGNRGVDNAVVDAMLAESAGGVVVEELVLEEALRGEMRARGLTLGEHAADDERALLVQMIGENAGVQGLDERERLLEEVRRNRGLGPVRFGKLLERSAMLRALVRDQDAVKEGIEPTEQDVRQAYEIKYGERVRARLILVRTFEEAGKALERVRPAPGQGPAQAFGDVAAEVSVDPSAARGGLIEPVSPSDPRYPAAIRNVFAGLATGAVSDAVSVSWPGPATGADGAERPLVQGYAIVKVEERIPGAGVEFDRVRDDLRREIRTVRERAAMDRLARQLTAGSVRSATVLDPALGWSWAIRSGEER